MHDLILRLKSWQVFLMLLAPHFASWYVINDVVDAGLGLLSTLLVVAWLVLMGNTLMQVGQPVQGYSATRFIVNSLIVVAALAYSYVAEDESFQITSTSFHATGLWMPVMLYTLLAYLQLHWFPASLLVAREQGRRPDFSQVIGPFLLLIFWPIGVWFMQERLNDFAKKQSVLPVLNDGHGRV
ncbi:hypothetical protein [Hymenobacter sp. CRA2]|uniref:hypothetical protein n=1 Tax=Hymenobacter sp. CRA2 TaxID=1955620 RepID=UPI000990332A|nr:hypothetical protein [Hymenobacter sp. CRA2]OON65299.1 hypothetical protein B0919_24370 [Hymenobacter sp. CRA2]